MEKKLIKFARAAKTGDKDAVKTVAALEIYKTHLESGKSARSAPVTEEGKKEVF